MLVTTVAPSTPFGISTLLESASKACGLLKAMANEDRLLILCQLSEGEHNVGELLARVGVEQPMLSQHLGILRDEGLVTTRRQGKYVFYSLGSNEVVQVMHTLSSLYCGKGKKFLSNQLARRDRLPRGAGIRKNQILNGQPGDRYAGYYPS